MLKATTYQELQNNVTDEKAINAFDYFLNKNANALILTYKNEAFFALIKNKNAIYEGYAYYVNWNNINTILIALKKYLSSANFIIYLVNTNKLEVLNKIDENIFYLKMHKYILKKPLENKNAQLVLRTEASKLDLISFYQKCFQNEFDENAEKWVEDFYGMEKDLEKEIIYIEKNDIIACTAMYWMFEDFIFIFLLGTLPEFRHNNLAYSLLFHVQQKFPNKYLQLSTWAGGETEKFYLRIGFEKQQLINACF
jgi:N-acetylglutamate synthase-like GNAT family acetyltransferase